MSLLFRDNRGNETHIAGLNGVSGELVPSVSLYKKGTVTFSCEANSWNTVDVTFDTPMPDDDYQVILDSARTAYVHVQNVTYKTTAGFTVIIYNRDVLSGGEGIINWQAFKLMTDEATQLDEAQIELNKQDITAMNAKIPANASSSNQLVAKSDAVTKYNYSMAGTASLEDDIKTFVTALIALGANTYAGFFNRSGSLGTAGNYSITVYAEEGTSTFASGYIALGAGAIGKAQYIVSYYKPTGSSEEWTIKELATTTLPTLNGTCKGLTDSECYATFDVTFDSWGGSSPAVIGIAVDGAYVNSKALIMVNNSIETDSDKKVRILYADGVNCLFRVFALAPSLYSNTVKVYVSFYTVGTDDYSFKVQQRDYIGAISNLNVTNDSSGMPISSWFQAIAQPSAPVLTTELTSTVTQGSTAPVTSGGVYDAFAFKQATVTDKEFDIDTGYSGASVYEIIAIQYNTVNTKPGHWIVNFVGSWGNSCQITSDSDGTNKCTFTSVNNTLHGVLTHDCQNLFYRKLI